ncbi:MAG TPA: VanZ family protein [Sandaracinaceae bacterium LLY-WYZ-13_1]|nr:VanZ family protein [Sandaracinaceae bacterium LLY-WYZ-13_1]
MRIARQTLGAWAPAALYMAAIWLASSLSLPAMPVDDFPFRDKGIHLVEYGVLGLLLAHAAFRTWPRHHPLRTAALAVLIAVLWGLLDEIHQAFVPGRSSEALDLVADTLGATLGAAVRYALTFASRLSPAREP